ncbi:MAG: hypothetical protein GXP62_20320, partial [Oligoflexia bacterium]|nr:hypothetical protein [Oligoflexia bacterium]
QSPAGALRRLAERDDNPDVRAAALSSLAALQPELAVTLARPLVRRLTDQEDWDLRKAAARVLGEHGDGSDLPALLDPLAPGRLRNDGLSAAARIAARQDDKAKKRLQARVARAAEAMLYDLDLRTRQHVIGVLGQVGDHSSVNRLEAFRRQQTVPDVAKAALDAITAIRGRKEPAALPPGQADARLKAIETRLDELDQALEGFEAQH